MTYRMRRDYKIVARSPHTNFPPKLVDKVLPQGALLTKVSDQYVRKDHPLWPDLEWCGRLKPDGTPHMAWFFTQFGLVPLHLEDVEILC